MQNFQKWPVKFSQGWQIPQGEQRASERATESVPSQTQHPASGLCAPVAMAHRHGSRGMQQHQRAGQNALSGPFFSATPLPLRTNLTKCGPSLRAELVVGFVPRAGRVLRYGLLSAGRRACRRVCWGGAGECSCGAPAMARHLSLSLSARVWRADAQGLITPSCHRLKASAGSTRPTQSPSQTPQGGNTTGGKQHRGRGETAHWETHPPTHTPPQVLQKRVAVQRLGRGG